MTVPSGVLFNDTLNGELIMLTNGGIGNVTEIPDEIIQEVEIIVHQVSISLRNKVYGT